MSGNARILAVDDEPFNLALLETDLTGVGFEVLKASGGRQALDTLAGEQNIDVVLLDRMMPGMDGMEVLRTLKADARYRDLPVIMQTASAHHVQVAEGLKAGAYYYLAKPYDDEVLISIVRAAVEESRRLRELRESVDHYRAIMGLIEHARFRFRTLKEAHDLAAYVASGCPSPESALIALNELMVNAVEHGNLGITYDEKSQLLRDNRWGEEIALRLDDPCYRDRYATITVEKSTDRLLITIKDQGEGFDWEKYLEFDFERLTHPHGRGIAMARASDFSGIDYLDGGSKVVCTLLF